MAILSQRAYARHRGVALSAVQKAIETGRISAQADGRIDSEQADVDWEQNTTRHAPPIAKRGQDEDDASIFGASQYTKARAVREYYQARLARIEYEERVGKLVAKDGRSRCLRLTTARSSTEPASPECLPYSANEKATIRQRSRTHP